MQEVFQCSRASNWFHLCSSRLNFLYTPLVVLVLDNKCSMDRLRLLSRLPNSNLYQERGLVNFPFRISLCHWFSRVSILVAAMQVVFQCSSANSRFHLCSSKCCQGGRSTIIPQGVACLMFPCQVLLKACFPFLTILLVGCLCVMGEYLKQLQLGHWLLPFQMFLLPTRGQCWAKICIHYAEQLVPGMETEGNWHSSGDGSEVFCICWSHQKQALKAKGCGGCLK